MVWKKSFVYEFCEKYENKISREKTNILSPKKQIQQKKIHKTFILKIFLKKTHLEAQEDWEEGGNRDRVGSGREAWWRDK